jgi:hypothetical protein
MVWKMLDLALKTPNLAEKNPRSDRVRIRNPTLNISSLLFSFTYNKRRGTGQDLEQRAGQDRNQRVTVAQRIDESGESGAAVRQPGEGLRVEEDLLLGEEGGEEGENVPDAELLEEEGSPAPRHGDGGEGGRLHHLPVVGAQAELHRASTKGNVLKKPERHRTVQYLLITVLVWIRIRGSMPMPLTNGSGSCYFRH